MSIEENKEARHKARQQKVKEQVDAKNCGRSRRERSTADHYW